MQIMIKAVKMLVGVAVACLAAGCLTCGGRTELPSGFVHVTERVPDAILEIRYHSTYNFVGKRIDGYDAPEAILTEEAAAALRKASDALKERGYRLKIYEAYRPQRAVDHFMRWAADRGDAEMKAVFYPEHTAIRSHSQSVWRNGRRAEGSAISSLMVRLVELD